MAKSQVNSWPFTLCEFLPLYFQLLGISIDIWFFGTMFVFHMV